MDGWLVLDKPLHMTSAQAVAEAKRLLYHSAIRRHDKLKIGHAGTLDPLASGILPLALGEATKTVQYAMNGRKTYQFTVTWGESRTTDDAEGAVVATSPVRPHKEAIEASLPEFIGEVLQTPPAYSAIKLGGKRAYQLARAGQSVEIMPRKVEIISLHMIAYQHDSASFVVDCGKGTYIRSLARDLAVYLGTVGYVSTLRRTVCGKFSEAHAISLEMLEKMVHNTSPSETEWLHSVESVLDDIPALEITPTEAARLKRGQRISLRPPLQGLIRAQHENTLVALCEAELGVIKPVRVFNL